MQCSRTACRRVVGGQQLEDAILQYVLLLVNDRIASTVNEHFWRNPARQRKDLAINFQRVRHRQAVWMARHGNNVLWLKDIRLLVDVPPHFSQREPVCGGIEVVESSSDLDGLKSHTSHAGLLQREIDNGSNFVLVNTSLKRNHQRGRDAMSAEPLQCTLAYSSQVLSP